MVRRLGFFGWGERFGWEIAASEGEGWGEVMLNDIRSGGAAVHKLLVGSAGRN